jgi:hypothetical protein
MNQNINTVAGKPKTATTTEINSQKARDNYSTQDIAFLRQLIEDG